MAAESTSREVLPRAKKLGLVEQGTTKLSEQELVSIISRPGFSTAEKVTEISGRGVGFDIVATRCARSAARSRCIPTRGSAPA